MVLNGRPSDLSSYEYHARAPLSARRSGLWNPPGLPMCVSFWRIDHKPALAAPCDQGRGHLVPPSFLCGGTRFHTEQPRPKIAAGHPQANRPGPKKEVRGRWALLFFA